MQRKRITGPQRLEPGGPPAVIVSDSKGRGRVMIENNQHSFVVTDLSGSSVLGVPTWSTNTGNQPGPKGETMRFPEMYCDINLEYPGSHIALGGFGVGCSYDYVSSTFLEGFVNYTKVVEARLLDRYCSAAKNTDKLATFMSSLDLPFGERRCHTSLTTCFRDDVLLLCKSTEDDLAHGYDLSPTWWFYWFDRDCSDCSIACFRTSDTDSQVIKNFQELFDSIEYKSRPIPPEGFVGWITF